MFEYWHFWTFEWDCVCILPARKELSTPWCATRDTEEAFWIFTRSNTRFTILAQNHCYMINATQGHSGHTLGTLREHSENTQKTLTWHQPRCATLFFKFYEVLRCWLSPYVSSSFLGYFSSNGKKSDKLHSLSKLCNSAQFWPFHLKVRMMRKKHAKISHEVETFGVFEEYCSKHRVKTRAWHPKDGYLQYPDLIAALGNQSA